MRTDRLLLIGMIVGFTGMGACGGDGESSGRGAGGPPEIPGLGDSPGFGAPSGTGSNAGTETPSLDPTPGFGGPGNESNAGTADPLAFGPGFGSPSGAAGSTAPSGGVSSGIPGGQSVSELDASEVAQLCEAVLQRSQQQLSSAALQRFSCTLAAVNSASQSGTIDVAACEDAVDQCVALGSRGGSTQFQCNTSDLLSTFAECEITVGEFQNCLSARFAQLAQLVSAFTCRNASDPQAIIAMLGSSAENLPAACSALEPRCPGLLGQMPMTNPPPVTNPPPDTSGCTNTCRDADDGFCDDGGEGSFTSICALGTDCGDCGPR